MYRHIITTLLALAAVCGGANAQWKQGDVPPSSRRGSIAPTEIDKAEVTVYYAFNASDIKDESTYIDLGWLQVGKQYTKYASYFVAHSDSTYKPVLIKNSNGEIKSISSPVNSKILRASRSLSNANATKASPPIIAERITGGTSPASIL